LKKLIILFFTSFLFGLSIVVDTTNDYSILTMKNNLEFACKQKNKNTYICRFDNLPSTPVFATSTVDFNIKPFFGKDTFYLQIKVNKKSFIKSFKKDLYEGYNKRLKNIPFAKKWVIVAYKNKPPFLSNKPIKGLKFPVKTTTDFYLKAIDINGNPIDYNTQTADVRMYFKLLKMYKKGNLSISDCDDFIKTYPKSLFVPDVMFLKLKLMEEEQDEDIVNVANEWLKNYSFNEHLPEVLLILAKAYANNGMIEDATYMYERLFTEYENTKYAYEGMIYLADELYSAGDNKRAFELYKQAFENTKDIEVASLAAYRLAQRYLSEGNIKESLKYYNKLFKANKQFILKDKENAYNLAKQLASHNAYTLAIKIGQEIFKTLKNKDDDLYEPLLYRLAKWSYEKNDYALAQKYIEKYIDEFPFGDHIDEIKKLKDKLLFDTKDKNETELLQKLDDIIKKYKNTDLATKAKEKKAEILYKEKKYKQFLNLVKELKDFNKTMIKNGAKQLVIKDLKDKNCVEGMQYYKEYNITLPKKYDDELFYCAYKVRDFDIASVVCNKYLLGPQTLKWLKNKAKVFEATHNYEKLALIIEDICNLQKHKNCYEWKYKQFFAYYKLNKPKEFLKIASQIPFNHIKNIDIYMKVVLYATKKHDNLLAYTYAKKIIKLQKMYNTYIQSPYIDFVFANVATKLHKKQEAIKDLEFLVTLKNINDSDKARAYYLLSSLTGKSKYLKKCIKLKDSTWKSLCKDSLEVLSE